ncbi:MAG: hypothetical protein ACE5HO_14380 [bacterium]
MRQRFNLRWSSFFILTLWLLYALGCSSDSPVAPENGGTEVNATVQKVSANGADIYSTVSSFKQVSDLMQGPESFADLEIPEVQNPGAAMNFAKSIMTRSFDTLKSHGELLTKTQGVLSDSVIWDITERDDKKGVTIRSSLIYDPETGKARLFFVEFNFRDSHPLDYDSTEIAVDLNFTIFDDTDDVLLSLVNLKRYKPDRLIAEEMGSFVPDPYPPGTEPTGGVLTSDITYSSTSFIESTHAQLEYHEGVGGSYSKEVKFSDGTSHSESVTFDENGNGTFSENRRDGTSIEGTFDSADNDGQGSFSKTTTFPDGHDPVSISESGNFTINAADSTLNGTFDKEVKFKDGSNRKESVTVTQTVVGDVKTTTIEVESTDGGSGSITVIETPDVDQISGQWTNPDQTYLVFSAEYYPDGSAHFEFKLYESLVAFQNGADPIASGEFDYFPDGSGHGTVTEGDQTYDVTINPDGSMTVKDAAGGVAKTGLWR